MTRDEKRERFRGLIFRQVKGALKLSINSHGSVTRENYGSAAKRIASQVEAFLHEKGMTLDIELDDDPRTNNKKNHKRSRGVRRDKEEEEGRSEE